MANTRMKKLLLKSPWIKRTFLKILIFLVFLKYWFLVVSHDSMRGCVCPLVRPSICPSVLSSITSFFGGQKQRQRTTYAVYPNLFCSGKQKFCHKNLHYFLPLGLFYLPMKHYLNAIVNMSVLLHRLSSMIWNICFLVCQLRCKNRVSVKWGLG